MCTLVVLHRPGHAWPMLFAANRDEVRTRPWLPPGRHWPDRPNVVAGLDQLAGGTWLGINDEGVVAAVMNRVGTLGPAPDKRSRGELVLEALDHADATSAAEALAELDPNAYRPFNLLVADHGCAHWLRHADAGGSGEIEVIAPPPGLFMLTARDCNDESCARIRGYLPRFRAAPLPDPDLGNWAAWEALLASRDFDSEAGPPGAMTIVTGGGFGTVSSALLALPAPARREARPVWRFAAGAPDRTPFENVRL